MKIDDIRSIRWSDYSQNYLIDHPILSPVLADPTFTFPENSPDNKWHLFAHSVWGIHHFISSDGIKWDDRGVVIANVMRPYLYRENDVFYLLYEKYRPLSLILSWIKGRKWYSEIAMSRSKDLKKWSAPVTLISPLLSWHTSDGNKSVSNPCLIKRDCTYQLYYSASLVLIPDCGFNEPDSIGLASSASIDGPYKSLAQPVITVNQKDSWCNLSCGSIKVLQCEDGLVGFENGIYWDEMKKQSGSAIIVLKSIDGAHWDRLIQEPIIRPSSGWRKSHIYACDVRYREQERKWYLYYNARNGWQISEGQERIGLLTGLPS
ncbi:MAG: glycosyl hydrolase family 43 [Dehalococcoidia bacterium]|jgi:hypothetical protein